MNKIILLVATIFTMTACTSNKNNISETNGTHNPIEVKYHINDGACGNIILNKPLANTLDKSIKKLEQKYRKAGVLPENYSLQKKPFTIDFKEDERKFYGISFVNNKGINTTIGLSDVIDTKGNHYYIDWCKD